MINKKEKTKTTITEKKDFRTKYKVKKIFEKKLSLQQIKELARLPDLIKNSLHISQNHFAKIRSSVQELFQALTVQRSKRHIHYLNTDKMLVAYAYYYLPWNCYKLVKLFLHLNADELLIKLSVGNDLNFLDFGSGPLTVVSALWIAYPKLRAKKITWYCYDVSMHALDLGEEIFHRLESLNKKNAGNWQIKKIAKEFGTPSDLRFDFYFSANMFNEFIDTTDEHFVSEITKAQKAIRDYLTQHGTALIVEPGTPHGGKIIENLRELFYLEKVSTLSPCTHNKPCPLLREYSSPQKSKWCNFTFKNVNEIPELTRLSEAMQLPKETLALSYLLVSKNEKVPMHSKNIMRIMSDGMRLPNNATGWYACSDYGFVLLKSQHNKLLTAGDIIELAANKLSLNFHDKKTKAPIINIE